MSLSPLVDVCEIKGPLHDTTPPHLPTCLSIPFRVPRASRFRLDQLYSVLPSFRVVSIPFPSFLYPEFTRDMP